VSRASSSILPISLKGTSAMSATKILWGQVLAVFAIVLAAVWGRTQWTAAALGYQAGLGAPWFMLRAHTCLFAARPFSGGGSAIDAYAPAIFLHGAYIAASGGLISIVVAIAMSVWRAREAKHAETYGSARWAKLPEVRAAGLLGESGVVLGKLGNLFLRHDGPEHVLCFAPTRFGQGRWTGRAIAAHLAGLGHRP
jgi:type IV secretion system protein VirD4